MDLNDSVSLSSQADDPTVGKIFWNNDKKKYDLKSNGEILVSSKDKGYLNYLVVKQKHSSIIRAGLKSTILVEDQFVTEVVETTSTDENLGISDFALGCINAELSTYLCGKKPIFSRPRGRPRKYLPCDEHKHTHNMGDNERDRDLKTLRPITKHKIILDFKEYLEEGCVPKKALESICELYGITYFQAFTICEDHMWCKA